MKIEKLIGNRLREKRWTLSIAESCTGGLICDRITDVPGSSDYFEGGMVNYSNESKARHLGISLNYIKRYGAVSPQVARKMAQGVRRVFNTTFGLSTTGVAGPTGGTKRSPIGRVFIGIASGKRTWIKKLDLKGSRREIKEKASKKALQFFYETTIHENFRVKNVTSKDKVKKEVLQIITSDKDWTGPLYLDASALAKLYLPEPGSDALGRSPSRAKGSCGLGPIHHGNCLGNLAPTSRGNPACPILCPASPKNPGGYRTRTLYQERSGAGGSS